MMMKNLIKTLWFILAIAWPSVVMAAPSTEQPQTISENIPNTACIEREWNHKVCSTAIISPYACLSITSSGNKIEISETTHQWKMKFTCEASDNTKPHNFYISCGNWEGSGGHRDAGQSFSYTCKYDEGDLWSSYNVSCYVDETNYELENTNPACIKNVNIGNLIPLKVCWNWLLEDGEECDLWRKPTQVSGNIQPIGKYLDKSGTQLAWEYEWMRCKSCKIIDKTGHYIYEPAECLRVDTPISVMNNELLPYRRSLYIKDAKVGDKDSCNSNYGEKKTLLREDTMKCHFNVYNGKHNESWKPIMTFTNNCNSGSTNDYKIFKYFWATHQTQTHVNWAAIDSMFSISDGIAKDEFWEYKLVLETVEYEYCNMSDPNNPYWDKWTRYWAVCQVNFAVTKPYVMHISTFGVSPIWTTDKDFLYDFYDMRWNQLLDKTDLAKTMNISYSDYENEENLEDEIQAFKNKYEKLAVTVKSNSTIKKGNGTKQLSDIFWTQVTIKKVPNQHIYFIEGSSKKITLKQENIEYLWSAYTIFVKWMDVVIEWNVLQYAMIITDKDHKMYFNDGWEEGHSSCASWWQVVQWIFIAWGWFDSTDSSRNQSPNEYWCPWWWLHVKWALIWEWIEDLMSNKRSQLNSWFNIYTNNAARERREKIIWWAAVLIEYNPSLWKILPPGAEIFTESLEVYRK